METGYQFGASKTEAKQRKCMQKQKAYSAIFEESVECKDSLNVVRWQACYVL